MPIAQAVELAHEMDIVPKTASHCLLKLFEEVKQLLNDAKLTLEKMKDSLEDWLREGWVRIHGDQIEVTRGGRVKIKEIAQMAYEPIAA